MRSSYDVILAPLVTEKSNGMVGRKKYVFKVKTDAGRIEIGRAVEDLFKVKVSSVNVMNCTGKRRRVARSAVMGKRPDWKKAIVTLSEGSIEIL